MGSKNWIEKATAKNKGSFGAAAAKDGKSTADFAQEKSDAKGKLGKRARLAETLMNMKGKK